MLILSLVKKATLLALSSCSNQTKSFSVYSNNALTCEAEMENVLAIVTILKTVIPFTLRQLSNCFMKGRVSRKKFIFIGVVWKPLELFNDWRKKSLSQILRQMYYLCLETALKTH